MTDASEIPTLILTHFVLAIVLNELHTLHEGNIARFRLRPGEFRSWIEGLTPDRKQLRP